MKFDLAERTAIIDKRLKKADRRANMRRANALYNRAAEEAMEETSPHEKRVLTERANARRKEWHTAQDRYFGTIRNPTRRQAAKRARKDAADGKSGRTEAAHKRGAAAFRRHSKSWQISPEASIKGAFSGVAGSRPQGRRRGGNGGGRKSRARPADPFFGGGGNGTSKRKRGKSKDSAYSFF